MTAKVSVCIAVYNVEKFIEQCVRSLFEQTLEDLEYIFVDDCSSDRSIDIMLQVLEEYPLRKNQVKLIRHNINKGVAKTRCDAIHAATGEYIIHCDPDDWVEHDMYETMYQKAKENDVDIVYCGYESYKSEIEQIPGAFFEVSTPREYLNTIFDGRLASLCNVLCRKEIMENSQVNCPSDIIMQEDLLINSLMLPFCKSISYVNHVFYHYRKHATSASHSMKMLKQAMCYKYIADVNENNPLLYTDTLNNYKAFVLITSLAAGISGAEFKKLYPDVQMNIMNTRLKKEQKLLLTLARHCYWLSRVIYIVVHNLRKIKI
ncbi:MAG: glycosyltransferase family 2 protein [Lentisphaeria bacterium]|nr:glycosyltransferase family 2 protein [Lentisphaeria bacterium]